MDLQIAAAEKRTSRSSCFSLRMNSETIRIAKCPNGAFAIALLLSLTSGGCGRSAATATAPSAASPDQIKQLVATLNSRQTDSGMGFDMRVGAAERLAEIGPQTQEYGAVPALEKLSKNRDPKIRQAAERALSKIRPK